MRFSFSRTVVLWVLAGALLPAVAAEKVVTLGTSVTEIAVRLGKAGSIAGLDQSSAMFKRECPKAEVLNYFRQISSEGVLSLQPTLVLTTSEAGPAAALEQIRGSGVNLVVIPETHSVDGTAAKIRTIARELGVEAAGAELISMIEGQRAEAQQAISAAQAKGVAKPRVLFVMSQAGEGALMCAGAGTGAEAMITMAGGVNAVSGFGGYKAVNTEALVAARPDVVLFPGATPHGFEGGAEALKKNVGLVPSPALRNGRVEAVDMGATLGFGASLGTALQHLVGCLYPQAPLVPTDKP